MLRYLIPILLIALGPTMLLAQQRGSVDAVASYEFGVPLGIDRAPGAVDWCNCSGAGKSYSNTVGLSARIGLPPIHGLPLALEAGISGSLGRFISVPYLDAPRFLDDPLRSDSIYYDFVIDAHYTQLDTRLRSTVRLTSGIDGTFGLWGTMRLDASFQQRLRLRDPGGTASFDNGLRERTIAEGDSIASGVISWGMLVGASTTLPIGSTIDLVPELYARIDPLSLFRVGVQGMAAGASLALRFRPAASPPGELPPPLPEPPRASIALYAVDTDGTERPRILLMPRRVEHRELLQIIPLLPVLGDSLVSLPSPRSSADARVTENHADHLARSMASLAPRLRRDSLPVTLVEVVPADEGKSVGGLAKVLPRLVERFGLPAARLTEGEPIEGGIVHGVELGLPPSLLLPAERFWVKEDVPSPDIGIRPEIDAPAGILRWSVRLMREGMIVGEHRGDDTADFIPELSVSLDDVMTDTTLAPLVAELTVEDSLGRRVAARGVLPVVARVESARQAHGMPEREVLHARLVDPSRLGGGDHAPLDSALARLDVMIGSDPATITVTPVACTRAAEDRAAARRFAVSVAARIGAGGNRFPGIGNARRVVTVATPVVIPTMIPGFAPAAAEVEATLDDGGEDWAPRR